MKDRMKDAKRMNINKEEVQQLEPVELSEADMLAIAGGRISNGQTDQQTNQYTKCCW
jgi:hypothetical protein